MSNQPEFQPTPITDQSDQTRITFEDVCRDAAFAVRGPITPTAFDVVPQGAIVEYPPESEPRRSIISRIADKLFNKGEPVSDEQRAADVRAHVANEVRLITTGEALSIPEHEELLRQVEAGNQLHR